MTQRHGDDARHAGLVGQLCKERLALVAAVDTAAGGGHERATARRLVGGDGGALLALDDKGVEGDEAADEAAGADAGADDDEGECVVGRGDLRERKVGGDNGGAGGGAVEHEAGAGQRAALMRMTGGESETGDLGDLVVAGRLGVRGRVADATVGGGERRHEESVRVRQTGGVVGRRIGDGGAVAIVKNERFVKCGDVGQRKRGVVASVRWKRFRHGRRGAGVKAERGIALIWKNVARARSDTECHVVRRRRRGRGRRRRLCCGW